ncbi:MAG: helix-turn-helix transcriptional regulator [Deltaproteobacteria bacterium]|nr:helix-turn-helix transcriptional regulator [Deltaproteobacteria bacterium]
MTDSDLASRLAANLRQLRDARGLTQAQAAKLAGLPRPTWTTLESGSANPTVNVLVRAGAALHVSIEELLAAPRATGRIYRADALRMRKRGSALVRDLLPEKIAGMEIERIELPRGAVMNGIPHTPGTREYLACERGCIELTTEGETFSLAAGDVVVFLGDQRHSYRNAGSEPAIGYSVVTLAPPAAPRH